ncbi:unnamed protein product [Acanthosepion pharaonis]|uniref:Uncharacterized protein n=1 Tax=Acanthosepion pharaonis TaxID=158019 RepID=A0A812DLH7_ACAPH|nr:unnamed protein product [Sepia pharaonis]
MFIDNIIEKHRTFIIGLYTQLSMFLLRNLYFIHLDLKIWLSSGNLSSIYLRRRNLYFIYLDLNIWLSSGNLSSIYLRRRNLYFIYLDLKIWLSSGNLWSIYLDDQDVISRRMVDNGFDRTTPAEVSSVSVSFFFSFDNNSFSARVSSDTFFVCCAKESSKDLFIFSSFSAIHFSLFSRHFLPFIACMLYCNSSFS